MRTIYRLYTERRPNLAELTACYFDGFTLIEAVGYWQGNAEPSPIVEVIGTSFDYTYMLALARDIRETNGQQSVYLVRVACEFFEVTADTAREVA